MTDEEGVRLRRQWVERWWARPDHRDIPFVDKVCELVEACVEDAVRDVLERLGQQDREETG